MDQNYNNSQNEFLWTLLAHPADDAQQYNYNLQRLVNDFPQSGILQALLAHTSDQKNLKQASVYFNAKALYKLINAPASLIGVADENIIVQNGLQPLNYNGYQQHDTNTGNPENYFSDHSAVETLSAADDLPATEREITHPAVDEYHATDLVETLHSQHVDEQVEAHLVEEQAASSHEHDEMGENAVAEGHADLTEGHETAPVEELPHDNNSETATDEIKDGITHAVPIAEPIINYAAGMGHRLPPEPVEAVELPNAEHEDAEHLEPEAHTTPLFEEHLVVDPGAPEAHTPPPIPEVHWTVDAAAPEEHTPPPIPEEDLSVDVAAPEAHTPPPIPEGHLVVDVPEAHTPPPIPEEHLVVDAVAPEEHISQPAAEEHWVVDAGAPEIHTPPPVPDEDAHEEHQHAANDYAAEQVQVTEEPVQQYRPWDETAPAEHHQPEIKEEPAPQESHQPEVKQEEVSHTIDDEVYDEIGGMEPDIIGNIAGADFFMFDRAFGEHKKAEPVSEPAATAEPVNELAGDADQQDVSKYHDEKMPYSFLWWLDKTRKEHSGVYQPYTAPEETSTAGTRARLKAGTDELQQQYYENIFHITSVEELDKSLPQPPFAAPPVFEHKKKEQVIIERFIQEEPQIRPQSSDKLDNENKAKKSSEDRDELVSETLAAIYSDQMLYHKAIASYKKLMLRFPEKSRYFAAKIEQLEKKTN
ncbi:hypothetical protein [Mucilaginibacter flavidus]|uniref:hypothetical protein n=1 Tax=Mucilaginibacter flavidus TaxID=2949309 RepID=UPI0020935A63|nr:hypothetical protein [Mucilaginibacter flavidus]MCO5946135.1 hypothetical protein [Mucilaginibacter flavidus]